MNTIIQTPTNQLQNSLDYYSKLGFSKIQLQNNTYVTDGKAIIEINPNRFARAGVKLYRNSWEQIAIKLQEITSVIKTDNGYILSDPSNCWIYLMEEASPVDTDLPEVSPSVLGNFAGVSLESVSIELSVQIWKLLGFSVSMGTIEQGWICLINDDGLTISIMKANSCPHLFFNPSLTYFNGKNNIEIIEKIRALHIPITEEITHFNKEGIVDNIIIRDPGGLGCFLFSD